MVRENTCFRQKSWWNKAKNFITDWGRGNYGLCKCRQVLPVAERETITSLVAFSDNHLPKQNANVRPLTEKFMP
jgi:hypothetical protein